MFRTLHDKKGNCYTVDSFCVQIPYRDMEDFYTIKTDAPQEDVFEFCTKQLHKCPRSLEEFENTRLNFVQYAEGYYTFDKLSENTYRYYVRTPNMD